MSSVGRVLGKNKKAYFDYEVLEKYEAGMVLTGAEVKSVRSGRVQMKGSYAMIMKGTATVENLHISHYPYSPIEGYDPLRKRQLLLTRKEIDHLSGLTHQKGLTLVPLELILKNNFIKMVLGVCRGKKAHDKRFVLKKRAIADDIRQGFKQMSR